MTRTLDLETAALPLHFYTVEKISGKRSKTPEGYLLIEDVPLARTGMMIYGPDEVPVPPGPDGLVRVERNAEEVFRLQTIASANGKDITNDHPEDDVCPDNWRELSHGTLMNPRRGTGVMDDFLLGDLLVKSKEGIELVESGKVELSMGYDSGYMTIEPGRGYQMNIIYNHVALVDKGRCGPRCSIGDRQYVQEKNQMSTSTARTADKKGSTAVGRVLDRIRKAIKTGDAEALEETLGDAEKELEERAEPRFEIHNHNHPNTGDEEMTEKEKEDKKTEDAIVKKVVDALTPVFDAIDKRFRDVEKAPDEPVGDKRGKDKEKEDEEETKDEAILGALEMEAPPGTNDREKIRKSRDSAFLGESFQDTVALAEILVPGVRVPTFDSALSPRKQFDTICNLRRTTLDLAYGTAEGRDIIDSVGGRGQNFRTMDCGALRPLFLAAGAVKKRLNNGGGGGSVDIKTYDAQRAGGGVGGPQLSIKDVQKKMNDYYAKKA